METKRVRYTFRLESYDNKLKEWCVFEPWWETTEPQPEGWWENGFIDTALKRKIIQWHNRSGRRYDRSGPLRFLKEEVV